MERLTQRIRGYAYGVEGISADKLTGSYHRGEFEATACIEKLAEYEDLEEQGKLLKLPCAVGDTVYTINSISPEKHFIYDFELDALHLALNAINGKFGKEVFVTREEAEAALEKVRGKGK